MYISNIDILSPKFFVHIYTLLGTAKLRFISTVFGSLCFSTGVMLQICFPFFDFFKIFLKYIHTYMYKNWLSIFSLMTIF